VRNGTGATFRSLRLLQLSEGIVETYAAAGR
jgi:hypothetical protein